MAERDRSSRRTMAYLVGGAIALVVAAVAVVMFQAAEPDGVPSPGPVPSAEEPIVDDPLL